MSDKKAYRGSLYQTADKRWVYQYKENGKRLTKRFRLKSEALSFIRALEMSAQETSAGIWTLSEWMDEWLKLYAKPTVKPATFCSYEQLIRGHIKPHIGKLYMNTMTTDDMQRFFIDRSEHGNLKTNGPLSPKTLTNLRNLMHLALDQAVWCGVISANPVCHVKLPKARRTEMRVLTREEQEQLIWAAQRAPEPAAFGIIFDLFTGLRIGELCALRWKNVYPATHSFRVCATRNRLPNFDDSIETSTSVKTVESTKTDNSLRVVYILDSLWADFEEYRKNQLAIMRSYPGYNEEGYVFCQENGDPYEPRTFQDLFKRCVRQAGIRDANFHALRHTFATRSLEQGMDVVTLSRLLGHASPSITLDKYGHALDDQKKRSVEKLNEIYCPIGKKTAPQAREAIPQAWRTEW